MAKRDLETINYLTTKEVSDLLGCTPITVRRMIKSGRLPAIEVGQRSKRISKDYVQAMVERSLMIGDSDNAFTSEN